MGDSINIDWGNQQPVAPIYNSFMAGMKLARDARVTKQADDARNAALANPNDLNAVNAFAAYDPQGAAALRANITNQAYAPALAEQLRARQGIQVAPNNFAPQAAPVQQGQPSFDQAFGPDTQQALQTPGAPLPALPGAQSPGQPVRLKMAGSGLPMIVGNPTFDQAFPEGTAQQLMAPQQPAQQGQAPQQPAQPQVPPQQLLDASAPHLQALGAAAMQGQVTNPNEALIALAKVGGPESVASLVATAGQMDVQRRLNVADANDALGNVAQSLLGVPQSQRAQMLQQMAPQLAQHGIGTDQINQAIQGGLSDEQLHGFVGQAIGVKGILDQANKDIEHAQTDKQIANQTGQLSLGRDQLKFEQSKGVMTPTGEIVNPTTGQLIYNPDQPTGGTGAAITSGSGKAWTPVGSGNSSLAVANKATAIAQAAGVSPTAPLTREQFLNLDMTKNEGPFKGKNNPGNIMSADGKTPVNYDSPAAYQAAQRAWLNRRWNQGYRTVADAVAGKGATFGGGGVEGSSTGAQAKAIAEGTAPPFTGRAAATGVGARIMRQVYEINPGYDARNYSPQAASYKSFTSGKDAQTVQALNNVAQHLHTLDLLGDALRNGNMPMFNSLAQSWAQATGQAAPTNFDSAKQIIGGEVVKIIAGAGGGQSDREEAARILSRVNSPAQLHGALTTIRDLVGSQFRTVKQKYEVGTGRNDFNKLLVPAAASLFGGNSAGLHAPGAAFPAPTVSNW